MRGVAHLIEGGAPKLMLLSHMLSSCFLCRKGEGVAESCSGVKQQMNMREQALWLRTRSSCGELSSWTEEGGSKVCKTVNPASLLNSNRHLRNLYTGLSKSQSALLCSS